MGWRERRDSKRSGCDKYGVGGRGQEKKMELGEELREGREIETKGAKDYKTAVSSVEMHSNACL